MSYYDDDKEYDDRWRRASFEARKNITPELIESFKEEEKLEVERANEEEKVFDSEIGGIQNLWIVKYNCLEPSLDFYEGWREKTDGTREQVSYYWGEGWLTSDELFDLRQKHPRAAP